MRFAFIAVLLAGLGIAGFAVYLVMQQMKAQDQEFDRLAAAAKPQIELVNIVVARERMTYGQDLLRKKVRVIKWPAEFLPEGAFQKLDDVAPKNKDQQREVVRTIEAFEPILRSKVTKPGENAGIASLLSPGMRAFTIRVDVATGVSGFLKPGDRVDVFWSGKVGNKAITRLIIEKLQLIAVDQIADQDRNRPIVARTITVEATPQVAGVLAQAQNSGKLSLSLRGVEDSSTTGTLQVDLNDVAGIEDKPEPEPVIEKEPEPEPEPVPTIRIRKGNQITIVPAN